MRRTTREGNSTKLLSVIITVTLALVIIYSNVLVATVPLFHSAHAAVGKSSSTLTSPALLATSGNNVAH